MHKNDIQILWLFIKARLLYVKNYFFIKLDRITRIEVALFIALMGIVFLHRINLKLYWVLKGGTVEEAWSFFIQVLSFLYLITFISVFSYTKRILSKPENSVLLSLPITAKQFTYCQVCKVLLPFLSAFFITIGAVFIFSLKADLQLFEAAQLLIKIVLLVLSAQLSGIATAIILFESSKIKHRLYRLLLLVLLVISNFLFILHFDSMVRFSILWFITFILTNLFLAHLLTHWSMRVQLRFSPQVFIKSGKKSSIKTLNKFIVWYIFPSPKALRPIIKKDTLFASRYYKSFLFTMLFIIIASLIGLSVIKGDINAAGWLVFVNVLGTYWLTNLSFKFNEESVENFAIIKTLNLSAKQYWWAKFFTAFLPAFWTMTFSYLLYLVIFGFPMILAAQSFFISLWLCFTLAFFQTNFSLYSYPYARYAPMWYNMYIVLAVLFFTILLFPPLTIAFLLLGYLAIFRVLKRINNMEVI